jgi:hypothetical protein
VRGSSRSSWSPAARIRPCGWSAVCPSVRSDCRHRQTEYTYMQSKKKQIHSDKLMQSRYKACNQRRTQCAPVLLTRNHAIAYPQQASSWQFGTSVPKWDKRTSARHCTQVQKEAVSSHLFSIHFGPHVLAEKCNDFQVVCKESPAFKTFRKDEAANHGGIKLPSSNIDVYITTQPVQCWSI